MVKHLEAICHLEGVGKKGNPQDFACRDKFSPGLTGATVVGFARFILVLQDRAIMGRVEQIYNLDKK